jgi:pilus assembly protein FimV
VDIEPAATATPVEEGRDEFDSFDFDLLANNVEGQEFGEVSNDSVDFDFDFDFDMPAKASNGKNNQQGNFGTPDLTDMDELETKLDLAKAYIEMGDAEAARDITEEVLRKGSSEQKKTAESILERLK